MDLDSVYTELIMEHNKNSRNKHSLENADLSEHGHNPSCGDDITLELKFDGDIISEAAFTGSGCAISQASTSIMIDLIKGKSIEEALEFVETFIAMIKKDIEDQQELRKLKDAMALKNISNMPARVKCAVLSWHTLKEALNERN
ncbi:Putative iron-sulfur cluster assembly scaffold protein for SUF system, SufE2 [Halanaerobium saccharolyticum subsp. saccharolyticum DSM 6643]|jgi:nitrogen fixation NifU-like protein|uniref:Putative iron-sulfur cluster assembly scaffold protein for SUF system, SufE2 n=1 Tax=Halanaerobium saccharolyticum subsp. saccharolyticum DSM 6643 TaxID=1293054 RepID=M5E1P7_9FIRM|nr:SUF system NifU family Fe-S cluster assembly protein [Halanaerobium saccharolyticum]CCU80237.1 Putative iron-sulfur cluster assembly scaffold protein for SUF system, SufE2 [Halanaerobium saccharolyticum subsp. saccharolyticum DSM 6643]